MENKRKKALGLVEYAFILGIVSTVMVGMNIYLKRGLQNQLREMTDHFISPEQSQETSLTAKTSSNSTITSDATQNQEVRRGGEMRLARLDNFSSSSQSVINDRRDVSSAATSLSREFIPQTGKIVPPEYPNPDNPPEEIADELEELKKQDLERQIQSLELQKEGLLLGAAGLEQAAATMESKAAEMHRKANHINCHGKSSCHRARSKLRQSANDLKRQAEETRQEASQKRQEAQEIQEEIDRLQQKPEGLEDTP